MISITRARHRAKTAAKNWTFLGASSVVAEGLTITLPATAQANDLIVVLGACTTGSISGFTAISSTAANHYKLAAGGETSISTPAAETATRFVALMYRATGGVPTLTTSATASPAASQTISLTAPAVVVVAGQCTTIGAVAAMGGWVWSGMGTLTNVLKYDGSITRIACALWHGIVNESSFGPALVEVAGTTSDRMTIAAFHIA